MTNMTAFDWCQNQRPWMTLKGHYALWFKTHASFGAHHENLNADRPILSATKMCPNDSSFWHYKVYTMRIFAGVPWKGGVKRQWGNRKYRFSGLSELRFRHHKKWGQHYCTVLFSLLSPLHYPKVHDLEWPWNLESSLRCPFYVKVSLLRTTFQQLG